MKKIKLNKLILKNFKGVKELEVSFSDLTNIRGGNGTGKTTIYDAFTWLLFDKDSLDRQSFEIKTLNMNNEVYHGLDHEVTGILNVDGKDITLKKIFREKWTKKKGEAERHLTGHETLCYVNELPVKAAEYKDIISRFISEQIFKLICNPLYFNANMKWQDKRDLIMEIIGEISKEKILSYKKELGALKGLLADRDIDTLKRSLAVRKRKLNEDIKAIPHRIDELNNSIQEYDFTALEFEIIQQEAYLNDIEEDLFNNSKVNDELIKDKNELYKLQDNLHYMEHKAKAEAEKERRNLEDKIGGFEYEIKRLKRNMEDEAFRKDSILKKVSEIEERNEVLLTKWNEPKNKELVFEEGEFICPTCYRPFEEKDIEAKKVEIKENFESNRKANIKKLTQEIAGNWKRIEDLRLQLQELDVKLNILNCNLSDKEAEKTSSVEEFNNFIPAQNLEGNKEYMDLKNQISELELKLAQPAGQTEEINSLKLRKSEINQKLDECKKKLNVREANERFKLRINELLEENKSLEQQIADLEVKELLCEEYTKTKVELMEASINRKFKYVKFKLFNKLVNGAIEDCCEALIKGVPFSNANKAAQINAGLDIINALCAHYGVQAPIFIDNRESINEIIDCDSQVINLIVSRDKELIVESLSTPENITR